MSARAMLIGMEITNDGEGWWGKDRDKQGRN